MDFGLAGKVAVVTGGSKGIGLAVTRSLLDEGARVVVGSRTPSQELQELIGEVKHVPVDLTDPQAPAALIDEAARHFGGVDILVNNAAVPSREWCCRTLDFSRSPISSGSQWSTSTCSPRCGPAAPRFPR